VRPITSRRLKSNGIGERSCSVLREDVAYLPGLRRPLEHWSLSHFWGP
jgi:hypothetical protein